MTKKEFSYLEVTTIIGCVGNCKKYCPQEVFLKAYWKKEPRVLSLEDWHKILHNIPHNLPIWFGDFSEPLASPYFMEQARMAVKHGHKLKLFTTLIGTTNEQIDELLTIPFDEDQGIVLHLPDGVVLKEPKNDPEYWNKVGRVITHNKSDKVLTVIMDKNFRTSKREDMLRGTAKLRDVVACKVGAFENFKPSILPNGDVYSCCIDMGLTHCVGNLITQNWKTVTNNIKKLGKLSICDYCAWGLTDKEIEGAKN